MAQLVKNRPAVQETPVQSLGWEDPLEEEMATHPSLLAWRIPCTEEPRGQQSTGLWRVGLGWRVECRTRVCVGLLGPSQQNPRDRGLKQQWCILFSHSSGGSPSWVVGRVGSMRLPFPALQTTPSPFVSKRLFSLCGFESQASLPMCPDPLFL